MKKGALILIFGIALAVVAYAGVYFAWTSQSRNLEQSEKPELAWLKEEFHLSESDFKRISALHAAYLPECQEMCRKIEAQNARLKDLLATNSQMTAEIESALAESARLRAECQTHMLRHFYAVSQTMPPEQGRRYLAWVQDRTFLSDEDMMRQK
ncbi:MAG TPA: periplasmic heavy metal sensor [Candidatus Angelobacter sp.]|nr:periplasmic heavy metal sensor [Candidatus Angelobacter sp.]